MLGKVGRVEMAYYEVTIEIPNGDWQWWRGEYRDFHEAAASGMGRADARLIRVKQLPTVDKLQPYSKEI